ncbi:MAG: DUF3656 domain-containing protein, partial [Pirellulaceae bacterium]
MTHIRAESDKPELLAPAGDAACLRAAVENGADAVYFGLDHGFNARARAANFQLEDLNQTVEYLRARGVRSYVTLNTLVFTDELPVMEETIRKLAEAGVTAVLVQDLGVARLVKAVCPQLAIHASTQMTLTSAESLHIAESLGVERVVLARELSLDEIAQLRKQSSMPLEVFVHGALCVAYSGQCLTSESLGGRSANRGQCAQACRLPYDLVCDGRDVDLGPVKYLLSPQDLAAYDLLPELMELGVCAFKIEGRLKSPEYVANLTHHYRRAIDAAWRGQPVSVTETERREMELSFSRGFSHGWLEGCDHKVLVPGTSSAKRGIRLGSVVRVSGQRIRIAIDSPIAAGDGVVFEGDREHHEEQGGRVYAVHPVSSRRDDRAGGASAGSAGAAPTTVVELAFQHGALDLARIRPGQAVWKTDDPQLTARLRRTFQGPDPIRRTPLRLHVEAAVGRPLSLRGQAESGAVCELVSDAPLEAARKHPLTEELLCKQLGRLGGTVYELARLDAAIEGQPMVPLSVLGELRHAMIRQLDASLASPSNRRVEPGRVLPRLRAGGGNRLEPSGGAEGAPELYVLCRTLRQLEVVLESGARHVYVDLQDIREFRGAVQRTHARGAMILLATPRIEKPGERGIFLAMSKHGADGMLVRNLGGLAFCVEHGISAVADFSLNATNELTVGVLRDLGARRVTPSYDLNREQLLDMVAATDPMQLEIVIHQHMPMFHMEHCVFCAVLSPGTNKTNCGRPCDRHRVERRDRIGRDHPLHADVGCRNTLFNAVAQSAAEVVPQLVEA